MGLRSSKNKSYDIAQVVSNKEISYKRSPAPLPKVELPPAVVVNTEENGKQSVAVTNLETVPEVEVQKIQTTALVVETPENNEVEVQQIQTTALVVESPENNEVVGQQIQTTALVVETNNVKPLEETQDSRIASWVNESNFKTLITQTNPDVKEIVSFKASPAMAAGENYATLMLRVKLTAKLQDDSTKDFSFMLKVAHDNKEMKEMLQVMNFFVTENAVYTDVIPAMEDLYRKAGVEVTIGPKSHQLPIDDPNIHYVLLNDLSLNGFKNANRLECLNMEHTLLVLRKLAQFHAASACIAATKGPYSAVFSPDMDNEMARNMMKQMFMSFRTPFLENLKTYDNCEIYYDAINKFFDNVIDEFLYGRTPRPDFFNCLNHGDSWSNNILFKYADDGKVEEALLVDFQNTNWGSPAQDLFYFIISSIQIDIKLSQYEYFIRYYHQQLTEHLNLLKYPLEIPNLKELHMQMIEYGSWATVTSFMTLGVVLLEPTSTAKFENFMADSQEGVDFKNAMYSGERYRKYIQEILPWLNNRGFLEIRHGDLDNKTDNPVQPTSFAAAFVEPKSVQSLPESYPIWLNESLFIDVIRADFENYQKILKFTVSPATSAGDNYSSVMLKVDIDIELTDNSTRNLSYMLKIPPHGEQAQAMIKMLSSFEKEIAVYSEIVPQFEKVFKEQAGVDVVFGPKCYKLTQDTGCETIVLENLKVKGFKNCDRIEGLDVKHTKAVLKKLAEFHAASAYVFATKGRYPEVFEGSMYNEESKEHYQQMTEPFMKEFMKYMEQYNGNEEYIDNMRTFVKDSTSILIEAHKIDWNKFNVLNHGDCWTNNIMFQYDAEGEISNTYFVDFQLTKYCSPAYDLYYFLLSSTKLELKLEQFDYFIRYYYENLKANLELLKYPNEIPTLKQLHIDLLDHGTFALNTVMGVMAVILLDPSSNADINKMMSSDEEGIELKKQMWFSERYRSHVEVIYPWLSRRGLLNFKQEELATKLITPETNKYPSWIDAEHFEDILKENLDKFEKILNINVKPAVESGENYASNLLRIKVEAQLTDGTTTTVSYILKLALESAQAGALVALWNFFEKETTMYSKYLKEFEKMYQEVGLEFVFGPKFYTFKKDVGVKDLILLEDLGERGFKCGDRREGLNMEHTKSVLQKLALFHAASAKYFELNGPYPTIFQKGIYTEETRVMFEAMPIDFMYDYYTHYEGYEEYKDKLPNLLDNHVDLSIKSATIDPTEFNVLNHGDSWLNNIMFKDDKDGHVEETYYIDFQACKYGSPAQDLWYFIISSTELGIKVDQFDYFIKYYHDNLVENLKLLKYSGKVPTLPELHTLMLKYGYIGFNTFGGVGAVCLLESGENANMENFSARTPEGDKFRASLFLNDKYKANAAVVLPWLARRGCLDNN